MKTEKKGIKIMKIIFRIIEWIKKIFESQHGSINNVPRGTSEKEK